jgi:hypothetical protein
MVSRSGSWNLRVLSLCCHSRVLRKRGCFAPFTADLPNLERFPQTFSFVNKKMRTFEIGRIDKYCIVVKNSVYLYRILLLPVKHVPRNEMTRKAPLHYGGRYGSHVFAFTSPAWECDFRDSRDTAERESMMSPLILLFLALALFACAFGLIVLRNSRNRAEEKRRNQYHDRV